VLTIAIDIGGTKTSAALIDENNDDAFLEHATWPSPRLADEAIEQIVTTCAAWTQQASRAGISFGGPFDFSTQTCIRSMHTEGWDGVELSACLQRELGIDVITDNDANVAALGEYSETETQQRDPMLYVTVSTGVGAGIVVDGVLLRGAHSLAGELGHLPIGHDKACNCGQQGCLERAVSGYWIERDYGQPAEQYLQDPHQHAVWITDVAQGIWSATMLLDPAVIVVGGGMTAQGDRLVEPLRAELSRKAEQAHRTPPALRLGDPTGRTVLFGAAILAREATRGSRR
jgi:glucokinase